MFNINIYQDYLVTKTVKSCYKSYDSDADDWFKKDLVVTTEKFSGGQLADNIGYLLSQSDFSEFQISTLDNGIKLFIGLFQPDCGESTDITYEIREMEVQNE